MGQIIGVWSAPASHGHARQLNIRGFGAQWLGLCGAGSNDATSGTHTGGCACWWSPRSGHIAVRWVVLYGSGLGYLLFLEGAWVVACRRSRHREGQGMGITRMPDEGSAEGGEDLAQEGHMCCSSFPFCVDGGSHLSRLQCSDLVDRKDVAQIVSGGPSGRPVVKQDDLCLLPAIQLEPLCR